MFRIRKVLDDVQPVNQQALVQVKVLLAHAFKTTDPMHWEFIEERLKNPFKIRYRTILYVAENERNLVVGAALFYHEPILRYGYLNYLTSENKLSGRGIGGALYQRVVEECRLLGLEALFFECLPDDPALCRDPELLKQNQSRLRFYETMGARPIEGTAYETPVKEGADNAPYLMFDDLGLGTTLRNAWMKKVVLSILKRIYKGVCPPDYNSMVLSSMVDDPLRIRAPKYKKERSPDVFEPDVDRRRKVVLVVNEEHDIFHVRERGYVEAPIRIDVILKGISTLPFFSRLPVRAFPDKMLLGVHQEGYLTYLKKACEQAPPNGAVYANVFPGRQGGLPGKSSPVHAGYFMMDTYTPITMNSYKAARSGVDCCLTAADSVISGNRLAYALVRPPGHHAEQNRAGGFCFLNNGAIAADYLSRFGRVAMLDVDYHHGNGQQAIFYHRKDIMTLSLHRHPDQAYPYFSGFVEERGEGEGKGYNINFPLGDRVKGAEYMEALKKSLMHIRKFSPAYLVVCLGFDTASGDPTGSWLLRSGDFKEMGAAIGRLFLPTLIVQEGGYLQRSLGRNALNFFAGLHKTHGGS